MYILFYEIIYLQGVIRAKRGYSLYAVV